MNIAKHFDILRERYPQFVERIDFEYGKLLESMEEIRMCHQEMIIRNWAEETANSYRQECEDARDAAQYMIMDANSECQTSLSEHEIRKIIHEILGIE